MMLCIEVKMMGLWIWKAYPGNIMDDDKAEITGAVVLVVLILV